MRREPQHKPSLHVDNYFSKRSWAYCCICRTDFKNEKGFGVSAIQRADPRPTHIVCGECVSTKGEAADAVIKFIRDNRPPPPKPPPSVIKSETGKERLHVG